MANNRRCIYFSLCACLCIYVISSVVTVSEASFILSHNDQDDDRPSFLELSRERRQTHQNETKCIPTIRDKETYYSMEILENAVDDYWIEIIGERMQLVNSTWIYPRIDLPFKFPFYDQTINHVFTAKFGFLGMSGHPNETRPSHIISPFFVHFANYTTSAFYETQDDRVVVEWRDVFMNGTGPNIFQTIVFQNGTIMFLYKEMGQAVPPKSVMARINSRLDLELQGTAGVKATFRYEPLTVNPEDIVTGTVVIFTPLSLCELSEDTQLCKTPHDSFYCKHCHLTQHCPWSIDKLVQQWMHTYCKNTKPPGCGPDKEEDGATPAYTAIVVVVVVLFILISILGGWAYYAYNNPTTASGRWLIEHRPRQWRSLCVDKTKTTKDDDKSPSKDKDDSMPKDGDISPDL